MKCLYSVLALSALVFAVKSKPTTFGLSAVNQLQDCSRLVQENNQDARTICCSIQFRLKCIQDYCNDGGGSPNNGLSSQNCSFLRKQNEQVNFVDCDNIVCNAIPNTEQGIPLARFVRDANVTGTVSTLFEPTTDPLIGYVMPSWLIILLIVTIIGGIIFVGYVVYLLVQDKEGKEQKGAKKHKKKKHEESKNTGSSTFV